MKSIGPYITESICRVITVKDPEKCYQNINTRLLLCHTVTTIMIIISISDIDRFLISVEGCFNISIYFI